MSEPIHRDFDADVPELEPSGTFVLGGKTWRVRAKEQVAYGFLNIFTDGGNEVKIGPFFRATLFPADVDGFMEMIEAPDGPLTPERATAVMDYVAELVLARPTKPAGDSSTGSTKTGAKSEAGSSGQGTRRRRSA